MTPVDALAILAVAALIGALVLARQLHRSRRHVAHWNAKADHWFERAMDLEAFITRKQWGVEASYPQFHHHPHCHATSYRTIAELMPRIVEEPS